MVSDSQGRKRYPSVVTVKFDPNLPYRFLQFLVWGREIQYLYRNGWYDNVQVGVFAMKCLGAGQGGQTMVVFRYG